MVAERRCEAGRADSFLARLAAFRDLYLLWQDGNANRGTPATRRARQEQALGFVRRNHSSVLGWAALCLLQDRAGTDRAFSLAIADACACWARLRRHATSRPATCWPAAGGKKLRELFRELYEKAVKEGKLLPIDASFRQALQSNGKDADLWSALMQQTADALLAAAGSETRAECQAVVVTVAWQCWQQGDAPLAAGLLAAVLDRASTEEERLRTTLTGIDYLWATGQFAEADGLIQGLLAQGKLGQRPTLQRLGARIAERRG